jgi:hypothetical protein
VGSNTTQGMDMCACVRFLCFCTGREYNETVHQLFVDFKKAYDSVRREVLYNILIEFWLSMKLVGCLNETYSKVRIGKYLSDNFPIQNGLNEGEKHTNFN